MVLSLNVIKCLIALGSEPLQEEYQYEDPIGQSCFWCPYTTINQFEKMQHQIDCPIMLSRQELRDLGTPLKLYNIEIQYTVLYGPNNSRTRRHIEVEYNIEYPNISTVFKRIQQKLERQDSSYIITMLPDTLHITLQNEF